MKKEADSLEQDYFPDDMPIIVLPPTTPSIAEPRTTRSQHTEAMKMTGSFIFGPDSPGIIQNHKEIEKSFRHNTAPIGEALSLRRQNTQSNSNFMHDVTNFKVIKQFKIDTSKLLEFEKKEHLERFVMEAMKKNIEENIKLTEEMERQRQNNIKQFDEEYAVSKSSLPKMRTRKSTRRKTFLASIVGLKYRRTTTPSPRKSANA